MDVRDIGSHQESFALKFAIRTRDLVQYSHMDYYSYMKNTWHHRSWDHVTRYHPRLQLHFDDQNDRIILEQIHLDQ